MASFVPRFTMTPLMIRQIMAIESARGCLEAVAVKPEWEASVQREARVKDALASVQIEGNSLTYEEAFALAEAPTDRSLRESEVEFLNYLRAFEAIDDLRGARDYRVNKGDLLNIHRILTEEVRGGHRFSGRLRLEEVSIGDRVGDSVIVHHQPPPHTEVEAELDALLAWIVYVKEHPSHKKVVAGEPDPWLHPVIVAGIAQHRFVWIHPFVDGNGRTARMFTTLLLYQRGYDFKMFFDLSTYYNANRDAYYEALRTVDATGDYTQWLMYFMGGFSLQMFGLKQRALKHGAGLAAASEAGSEG